VHALTQHTAARDDISDGSDSSSGDDCGDGFGGNRKETTIPAAVDARPAGAGRKVRQALLDTSDEDEAEEAALVPSHGEAATSDMCAEVQRECVPRRRLHAAESSSDEDGGLHQTPAETHLSPSGCDGLLEQGSAQGQERGEQQDTRADADDRHGESCSMPLQAGAVEVLEGDVHSAISEDAVMRHKTPKKTRVAYNQFVREAQAHEKAGQLGRAVTSYRQALALSDQDEKLVRKVQKLENLRAVRRQSKRQSVLIGQVEEDGGVCEAQEGWVYDFSRGLYALSENPEYGLNAAMYTRLLPYQRDGVRWLWQLHCAGPGGILGDEMGLGKTCQTVIYLGGAMEGGLVQCVLIVAPVSVLSVWCREFEKFCPNLSVRQGGKGDDFKLRRVQPLLYHGTSVAERDRNLAAVARSGGVLITSYGMASSEKSLHKLCGVQWDYIVCDEGHKLKNPNIQTSKGMRKLRAGHRLLLTGTPLQNNLQELRALYDFAVPGLLPSVEEFKSYYARPITDGADRDATAEQRRVSEERARELRDAIRPYQLARTKAHVFGAASADSRPPPLPGEAWRAGAEGAGCGADEGEEGKETRPGGKAVGGVGLEVSKTEWMVWLELSPLQKLIYREFLDSDRVKQALASSRSPLVALTVLKKICDSPFLLQRRGNAREKTSLEAGSGEEDSIADSGEEEDGAGDESSVQRMLDTWVKQVGESGGGGARAAKARSSGAALLPVSGPQVQG